MKRGPVSLDHSDYVVTGVMKTPVFSVFFKYMSKPKRYGLPDVFHEQR